MASCGFPPIAEQPIAGLGLARIVRGPGARQTSVPATTFLLLVLIPALLFAFFWRVDRTTNVDMSDGPTDPNERDLLITQIAAGQRLRREAAETTNPEEKASLTRLAEEAEADAEKLKHDIGFG